MSTDKSGQIAESFGAKIIDIPNGTFNHGLTRNVGVRESKGELIYFTVQDAYLSENDQLEKMAAHFIDDKIASVSGIQGIPGDIDKNPAIWFKRFTKPVPEVKYFPKGKFEQLTAKEKLANSCWDNVNAMYRRSALQTVPFRETDFAEDALWARDTLLRGWKIIRDPSLVVYHYHHQTFISNFKTTFIVNYTFWKQFKILPDFPSIFIPLAKNIYTLIKRKELSILSKARWIFHNFLRLSGNYLSTILFKSAFLFGKDNLLDKSYRLFCSKVPQGKQNKNNKTSYIDAKSIDCYDK